MVVDENRYVRGQNSFSNIKTCLPGCNMRAKPRVLLSKGFFLIVMKRNLSGVNLSQCSNYIIVIAIV